MEPTAIVEVVQGYSSEFRNKTYQWRCNDGNLYPTTEMVAIIGTTRENLLNKFYRYGVNNEKLFVKSKSYFQNNPAARYRKKEKMKDQWCCNVDDHVTAVGREVVVAEIVFTGSARLKEKSLITACRIDRTGIILKRSPIYVGDKWKHIKGEVA